MWKRLVASAGVQEAGNVEAACNRDMILARELEMSFQDWMVTCTLNEPRPYG
jgi:hypothetical protein